MGKLRKIALIICASNFERQRLVTREVHEALKEMGDYALYVFSNYGVFYGDSPYLRGAKSIYRLLRQHDFDGCIIDSNLGDMDTLREIAEEVRKCHIPVIGLNIIIEDVPFVILDGYSAQAGIMEHLIHEHHCRKINFIGFAGVDIFTEQALQAYKDVLLKEGIPLEEKRILRSTVSIDNGRDLYDKFLEAGVEDADATICLHDVLAIGLCLEMEKRGLRVPEDMRLCTLNYSSNSVGFRPTLTGADRQGEGISRMACQLLVDMLDGREIPKENYYKGKIYFGQSCGCTADNSAREKSIYQDIILNKIEVGGQISRMMNYNDALESAESLQELGDSIFRMLEGDKNSEFLFCLNKRDIGYIMNTGAYVESCGENVYDDTMTVLVGNLQDKGRIENVEFPVNMILPLHMKSGDIFILMPVHQNERVFGYMVHINNYAPIDVYNHRILHESIGSSIVNLRKQMILHSSIKELDELHMHDALTGLFNRYAQERYKKRYMDSGSYAIIMIDMDDLKGINDTYGHLAGNNALNILAGVLKECVDDTDLLVRYAGDEFLILSYITDDDYWKFFEGRLDRSLKYQTQLQKLPYTLGASMGYSVCDEVGQQAFVDCYNQADSNMYLNKRQRKSKKNPSGL